MKNPFKLEKLKITAYSHARRNEGDRLGEPFEAMFNPESYKQKYRIEYAKGAGVNNGRDQSIDYAYSEPSDLALKLILDGTHVSDFGIAARIKGKPLTVSERFEQFLELAYRTDGELHEPRYLKVSWGDLAFPCRLRSAEITYTSFDRDGKPLRAELDVVLLSDEEATKQMRREQLSSPDLTHTRIVRSGDTLPYLCREIYGSSHYYLQVAAANGLNNFRRLLPGQEIVFPPIEK